MTCQIANSVTIHADEPAQLSIGEVYGKLIAGEAVNINGQDVDLQSLTGESFSLEDYREAAVNHIKGDSLAIYDMYLKAIQELML